MFENYLFVVIINNLSSGVTNNQNTLCKLYYLELHEEDLHGQKHAK